MSISLRTWVVAATFGLLAAPMVMPKASAQLPKRAHVSRIVVSGNTVLRQQDIDAVKAPYLNRDLDADAIEDLRRAITLAYIKHGYIASGAVVPAQDIAGGTLTIEVVEGYLTGIDVSVVRRDKSGQDQAVPDRSSLQQYVCDRLALPPGGLLADHPARRHVDVRLCERTARMAEGPLNMNVLEHRVAELLQDPNLARLNVEVRPASSPGQAVIDAKVVASRPWSLYTSVANDQPPNVGAMYGEIGGTLRNLLSYGDAVSLSYGRTHGANIASARYEIPLTRYDTRLGVFANYNGAGVVSAPFSGLGITSRYVSTGIELIQPLLHDETQTVNASLSWDYTLSDEWLLGQPFSFSAGYVNGHAQAAQVHASLDWIHRTEVEVISLRGTFTHGLNMLGATNLPSAPNADFSSGLAQAQYARRWGPV
ncbi:MAG: ShlB/FhaC/HecB family hemolysin secretion/activation protein, partial [Acetobacteraceae bacterium]|nr:ShlB/FhaC/HecB family hemolysin secretion/activation protein [Acetobacteraceae bacterium]